MKVIIIVLLLTLSQSLIPYKNEQDAFGIFQNFIRKYEKSYSSFEEFMERYRIFKSNLDRPGHGNGKYVEGITQFFDMTPNEFKRKYLTLDSNIFKQIKRKGSPVEKFQDPPETFNWVDKGAVAPVKNQRNCGACYAFATCANLEGQYFLKHNIFINCSVQNIVDCDDKDEGCDGGNMINTFPWVKDNGGLMSEQAYFYEGYQNACRQDKERLYFNVYDWVLLDTTDEVAIRDFLLKTGPLAVAINAIPLQSYESGIVDVPASDCKPEEINHAVDIVGYGTENGKDFWIVKNSWGRAWGEKGFFRIARGKGTCGINTEVTTGYVN